MYFTFYRIIEPKWTNSVPIGDSYTTARYILLNKESISCAIAFHKIKVKERPFFALVN